MKGHTCVRIYVYVWVEGFQRTWGHLGDTYKHIGIHIGVQLVLNSHAQASNTSRYSSFEYRTMV